MDGYCGLATGPPDSRLQASFFKLTFTRIMTTVLLVCFLALLSVESDGFRLPPRMSAGTPSSTKAKFVSDLTKGSQIVMPLIAVGLGGKSARARLDFDQKEYENRPSAQDAAPPVDRGIEPKWKNLKAELSEYIKTKPEKGPTLVRLAWHASGTYDKMAKNGGSGGGTIRFREELAHGANAGLDLAISWMEPFYKKYNKDADLSYGDLYTLAGVTAIETFGGPKIAWRAGRKDSFDPADVTAACLMLTKATQRPQPRDSEMFSIGWASMTRKSLPYPERMRWADATPRPLAMSAHGASPPISSTTNTTCS